MFTCRTFLHFYSRDIFVRLPGEQERISLDSEECTHIRRKKNYLENQARYYQRAMIFLMTQGGMELLVYVYSIVLYDETKAISMNTYAMFVSLPMSVVGRVCSGLI